MAITNDTTDTIWVADPVRHQITRFSEDGQRLGTLGGFGDDGSQDYLTLNQPSAPATYNASGLERLHSRRRSEL